MASWIPDIWKSRWVIAGTHVWIGKKKALKGSVKAGPFRTSGRGRPIYSFHPISGAQHAIEAPPTTRHRWIWHSGKTHL